MPPSSPGRLRCWGGIALGLAGWLATPAAATNYTWNSGSGPWSVPLFWSPQGIPNSTSDNAYLRCTGIGTKTVTAPTGSVGFVEVDATSSCLFFIIDQAGTDFSPDVLYVGEDGRGRYDHSAGMADVGGLHLGVESGSTGLYNLSGSGDLDVSTSERVAWYGNATFTQTGGSHDATTSIYLGYYGTGDGVYSLSGSGSTLSAASLYVGNNGHGEFTQSAGSTVLTSTFYVAYLPGSDGVATLDGGTLTAANVEVGRYGPGLFVQSGGTLSLSGDLRMGSFGTGSGVFQLWAGTLNVADDILDGPGASTLVIDGGTLNMTAPGGADIEVDSLWIAEASNGALTLGANDHLDASTLRIGYSGTGSFTQNGGVTTVASRAELGWLSTGDGTYTLAGGSLDTPLLYVGYDGTGTFNHESGTATVTTLHIGLKPASAGEYRLNGGSLVVSGSIQTAAAVSTLKIDGGSLNVGGGVAGTVEVEDLWLGSASGSSGTHTLQAGQTLQVEDEIIGGQGTGVFQQLGGAHTIANDLALGASSTGWGSLNAAGGTLDIVGDVNSIGSGYGLLLVNGGAAVTVGGNFIDVEDVSISGGSIDAVHLIEVSSSSSLIMSDGSITELSLANDASAVVSGGSVTTLAVGDTADIVFEGGNFQVDGGPVIYGNVTATSGVLTGDLLTGSISITFARSGIATISLSPTCGDTIVDPWEDCDDGNTTPGDCCSAICQYEVGSCSDGSLCTDGDTCSAGVCNSGPPLFCDDFDLCTNDSCHPMTGCTHVPAFPDGDADGTCDPVDNCPYVWNDLQTNSDVLIAGDACQCGDLNDDGVVDTTDVQLAREVLMGVDPTSEPVDLDRCNVTGSPACDLADIFVLDRHAGGAASSVQNLCVAYGAP